MTWKSTVRDAAYFTDVPVRTLRRWVSQGRLRSWAGRNDWLIVDLEEVAELRDTRGQGGRLPRQP
jgi:excisionase family DNA binding protein